MPIIVLQHAPSDGLGRLVPIFRDLGHMLEVRRLDTCPANAIVGPRGVPQDFDDVQAVISLGGPMNVGDPLPWMQPELDFLKAAHDRKVPLIGICLGHQMIAKALGGEVGPAAKPEFGFCRVQQTPAGNVDTILAGVPWGTWQFQCHEQEVKGPPPDAVVLAGSPECKVQVFRAGLRTYGFQFHFESQRADVDAFGADRDTQPLMQKAGVTARDLKAQADEHQAAFDRIGDRIAGNLATFMFPSLRRLR